MFSKMVRVPMRYESPLALIAIINIEICRENSVCQKVFPALLS